MNCGMCRRPRFQWGGGTAGPQGGVLCDLTFAIVGDTRPPTEDDTSGYPTANILNMAFTSPVTGLSCTFDNYGTGAPTFYTAFDALDNVIATANISSVQNFGLITVAGTGVADLQINNGKVPPITGISGSGS